jgi:two-component system, cell cycle sensor histidine kinase and response regulator CckA
MDASEYCILVAEDDPFIRSSTALILNDHGYCVIEAVDGRDAMERAAKYDGTIHALVTDVRMPRMDGHELARQLKAMIPAVKVLIISAHSEADFPPEAHSHDFALSKPVTPQMILVKVAELLQKRGDSPAK